MPYVDISNYLTPNEAIRWAILEVRDSQLLDLKYDHDLDDDIFEFDRDPLEDDDKRRERKREAKKVKTALVRQYRQESTLVDEQKMYILMTVLKRIEGDNHGQ